LLYQRLALVYLAIFSGVGGGKRSGVNLVALAIFPLIFIFPVMNAFYGFNWPRQTYLKSGAVIVNWASNFLASLLSTLPVPFFKSIVYEPTTGPPFLEIILNPNVEATFGIKAFPCP